MLGGLLLKIFAKRYPHILCRVRIRKKGKKCCADDWTQQRIFPWVTAAKMEVALSLLSAPTSPLYGIYLLHHPKHRPSIILLTTEIPNETCPWVYHPPPLPLIMGYTYLAVPNIVQPPWVTALFGIISPPWTKDIWTTRKLEQRIKDDFDVPW